MIVAAEDAPNAADWTGVAVQSVGAILTALLVLMAFLAYRTATRTLEASRRASEAAQASAESARRANEQARRDSIERTRPYVYARLVPGLAHVGDFDLVISNAGQSPARNLTLEFDTWPAKDDQITESLRTMFSTPRTLPPRCSLRVMWHLEAGEGMMFHDGDPSTAGILEGGVIRVRYVSDDPSQPAYDEQYEATFDRSGLWPVPEDGLEPPDRWQKNSDIRVFYQLARVLVRRVGELGR